MSHLLPYLLTLLLVPAIAWAGVPSPEPPAAQILRRVMAKPEPTELAKALGEIDQIIAKGPKLPVNHYVRGWVLSHQNKAADAVAEYDRAIVLDPAFSDAMYNAGLLLARMGKPEEALARWSDANKADPAFIDAYYNAGQLRYNRKEFAMALEQWSKAGAHSPQDFDIAKKILQCYNALGDRSAAVKARERVFALWRTDEKVHKLTEYVFDQFDVGKAHIYANETFDPKGELFYVYTFRVTGPDNKVIGTVQLESSAVIQEMGTPYILGVSRGKEHRTTKQGFKTLPDYSALKPLVVELITSEFAAAIK